MKKAEDLLHLFEAYVKVPNSNGFLFICPLHGDSDPSLFIGDSYRTGEHRLWIKCFGGCDVKAVLNYVNGKTNNVSVAELKNISEGRTKAREIKKNSKPVAAFDYKNEAGKVVYQMVRFEDPDLPNNKDFKPKRRATEEEYEESGMRYIWSWPIKDRFLYNLNELARLRNFRLADYVFIPEGERKCDTITKLGLSATCNPFGATVGKWLPQFSPSLKDLNVVLMPDKDPTGYTHIYEVFESIQPFARSIRIVELPVNNYHDDVVDWVNDYGGTKEQLKALTEAAEDLKSKDLKYVKSKYRYREASMEEREAIEEITEESPEEILNELLEEDVNFNGLMEKTLPESLMNKMRMAREIYEKEGFFGGICEMCFSTGYRMSRNDDGYNCVEASVSVMGDTEEETVRPVFDQCNHGVSSYSHSQNDVNNVNF